MTAEGCEVKTAVRGRKVKVDDANAVKRDIATSKGVIVIDSAIMLK